MVRELERDKHAHITRIYREILEKKVTSDMAAVRRREQDLTAEDNNEAMIKRRKLEEEVDIVESRIILSPCVQATSRGGIVARNFAGASETSVVVVRRRDSSPIEEQCQLEDDLDHRSYSVSCCSTNRSEEKSKRKIEFVDFEENNGVDQTGTSCIYDNLNTKRNDRYSEESVNMDSSSAAMEIQVTESVVESRRRLKMQKRSIETTVKETELEDFFQAAEKKLGNQVMECSMKYNFDFEKDEPLGGRYEWVQLKP